MDEQLQPQSNPSEITSPSDNSNQNLASTNPITQPQQPIPNNVNAQVIQPQPVVFTSPQNQPTNQSPLGSVVVSGGQHETKLPKKGKRGLYVLMVAILVIILGLAAAYGLTRKSTASIALNCKPVSGNAVTKPLAIEAFKQVVTAIRASNQQCVNSLSSSFFLDYSKVSIAPSGNWITYNPTGVGPLTNDFIKLLPPTLNNSLFISSTYSRPTVETSSSGSVASGSVASYYHPAQGLSLSYPESNDKGSTYVSGYYFNFAFVAQNDKILIDDFIEGPANSL